MGGDQKSGLWFPAEWLFFSVDSGDQHEQRVFKDTMKDGKLAFFADLDLLIERKATNGLPILRNGESNGDFGVKGYSHNIFDESHRFPVNELGIIFLTPSLAAEHGIVASDPDAKPTDGKPRIVITETEDLFAGIKAFRSKITKKSMPRVSGQVVKKGGMYYNQAPWHVERLKASNPADLPTSAEEYERAAVDLLNARENEWGFQARAYEMAIKALSMDPNRAVSFYIIAQTAKDSAFYLSRMERAIDLGISQDLVERAVKGLMDESRESNCSGTVALLKKIKERFPELKKLTIGRMDEFILKAQEEVEQYRQKVEQATDVDTLEHGISVRSNPYMYKIRYFNITNVVALNKIKELEQLKAQQTQANTGGIDLTAGRMNVDIAGDNAAAVEPVDLKALENIEINALYIKGLQIKPLENLPQMLGVSG